MSKNRIDRIIDEAIDGAVEIIDGYVTEYFDSSFRDMAKAIDDLRKELKKKSKIKRK